MRVSQCCCGCTLKTGTLILLWLDLLGQGSSVIKAAVEASISERQFTYVDSAGLGWGCIALVIIIYGLVGVDKHRPSYLSPYIGLYVFRLACYVLVTMFIWVGSQARRDDIIKYISDTFAMQNMGQKLISEKELRHEYDTLVTTCIGGLIISTLLVAYFLLVIYSYYKQMQEEDKGISYPASGAVIMQYAAPANQVQGYDRPPTYSQQLPTGPYPQLNVPYPQPVTGSPNARIPVGYPQQQLPIYPQKQ